MKKSTKKKIVTIAMAICVLALGAAGTLAYFADTTKEATNTFTIGKVDIGLTEGLVDATGKTQDLDGTAMKDHTGSNAEIYDVKGVLANTNRTETGNNADNGLVQDNDGNKYGYAMAPGKQVDKDPVVTVMKGSEPCYVRMIVTLDHKNEFVQVFKGLKPGTTDVQAAIAALEGTFVGYDANTWKVAGTPVLDNEKNTITVTFNYCTDGTEAIVAKNTDSNTNLAPIITGVKFPNQITSKDAAVFTDSTFSVKFYAEAIQADGFDDAAAAWTAMAGQDPFTVEAAPAASSGETTDPTSGN